MLIVSVVGRVDHNTANAFREGIAVHLDRCVAERSVLVVDLAAMEYISSAGLRVFMILSRDAKARHGRIVLAAMQPLVREIFDISKFTLLFEIVDSVAAAVDLVAAAGE